MGGPGVWEWDGGPIPGTFLDGGGTPSNFSDIGACQYWRINDPLVEWIARRFCAYELVESHPPCEGGAGCESLTHRAVSGGRFNRKRVSI